MMTVKRISVVLGAFLLLALPGVSPAHAVDQGTIEVNPEMEAHSSSYPGFAAPRPNACRRDIDPASCASPYAQTQYPGCAGWNATYCDAFLLEITKPADYGDDMYFVIVTLKYDRGATNNQLDLYIFAEPDPLLGPSVVDNRQDIAPKSVRIFAPEAGPLYMTVINERGVNLGYTVEIEWFELEVDLDFSRPDRGFGGATGGPITPTGGRVTPSSDFFGDGIPTGFPNGVPESKPALVPGPDGELQKLTLPTIARGDRAVPRQKTFDPVVAMVVAALLGSGAVLSFLAIRRRQAGL